MKKIFSNIFCLLLLANFGWSQYSVPVEGLTEANAENEAAPLMSNTTPVDMYFGTVEIFPVVGINSGAMDFSPIPVDNNGIVFTSSRAKKGIFKRRDNSSGMPFTDLYLMEKTENGEYSKPRTLFSKVNRKFHDGTAVFSGEKMYFTRNNLKGKNDKDLIDLKIYEAVKKDDKWVDVSELPFNSDEFATCHPAVSGDGTTMIFSSDRPGGQGGMDLWSTTWDGSLWSVPVNLGSEINTEENEIFPFVDSQNRLFFASNGHQGLGGLDIFVCQNTKGMMSVPTNLGPGINSTDDDFGIWVSIDGSSGYFSSNRFGGKGGDDIYKWKAKAKIETPPAAIPAPPIKEVAVIVVDAQTNAPISYANVDWVEFSERTEIILSENETNTKPDGVLMMTPKPSRKYFLKVEKSGYQNKTVTIPSGELSTDNPYYIPMEKEVKNLMNGSVVNAMTNSPIAGADVEMFNLCDNSMEIYRTNASGEFNFEPDCNCSYKMTAKKNGFTVSTKTITETCEKGTAKIALATHEIIPPPVNVKKNKYGVTKFYEGQKLTLHDVYYDFDKWFIRDDAAAELNHLVSVMKQYPSLEIELGSHTDARGNDDYNRRLSQKRAEAAVNYIISKGISSSRITARGYGESMLTNQCANGVQCSDEEHQANRRTEVRITKIRDGANVIDQH